MTAVEPPADATLTETLRWVFGRLNEHDLAGMRAFWTDDTVEYFPNRACRGPDEIAAYFAETFAAVEGFHLGVVSIAEAGDDAFVHWRMTGTHVGRLVGVEGTGRKIALDGMDHFVIRGGKAVSNTVVFDQMRFARQIKLLPEDGTRADRALKAAFNTGTKTLAALKRRR